MLTGRVVRGAFTRISAIATAGGKSLVRMAPKGRMDMGSLKLGRILHNSRRGITSAAWGGPGLSSLKHMQNVGAFGAGTMATKYVTGAPFVSFAKTVGMQGNHAATEGLSLALFRGRHVNLI